MISILPAQRHLYKIPWTAQCQMIKTTNMENTRPNPFAALAPPSVALQTAAHAIDDMRRGWAIGIDMVNAAHTMVAVPTETVTREQLMALRHLGPVYLALTRERAAVLKCSTAVEPAVLITVTDLQTNGHLVAIADPTCDLSHPLQGPFHATLANDIQITSDGPAAILSLLKIGHLLPSAVMALVPKNQLPAELQVQMTTPGAVNSLLERHSYGIRPVIETIVQLEGAEDCRVVVFRPDDGSEEHIALVIGSPDVTKPTLVRLHSSCLTGDIMGSLRCDCGSQLKGAIQTMAEHSGVILYLQQEGRGIGFLNKMRAYTLQHQGFDTVDANERLGFVDDERNFEPAREMLRALGIRQVRLLTNNPHKIGALDAHDIKVIERIPHRFPSNPHNAHYLATKAKRSGHYLPIDLKQRADNHKDCDH